VSLIQWIDQRIPILNAIRKHLTQYPIPKNSNFWYVFGVISIVCLILQFLSGFWLAMYYKPSISDAFNSIQYIMREVKYGWLIRYIHTTGASALFIALYLHTFRSMIYGSYQKPRELVWLLGMMMMIVLMVEAFLGYLLPWGQMSYWGAEVVVSLFESIPWIGEPLSLWIKGDYVISGVTLNRFYAIHVIGVPLLLVFLMILHILSLHHVGSNNPDGIETKVKKGRIKKTTSTLFEFHPDYTRYHDIIDSVPFHPYGTVKDLLGLTIFLLIFCSLLFFNPTANGYFIEPLNSYTVNPLVTPEHIAPLWYFTPYYTILRSVPDKLLGIFAMASAILLLFFLPWIDRCDVRSIRFRSRCHLFNLSLFAISFIALGMIGIYPVTNITLWLGRGFTLFYFMFFVLLYVYSKNEKTQFLPLHVRYK